MPHSKSCFWRDGQPNTHVSSSENFQIEICSTPMACDGSNTILCGRRSFPRCATNYANKSLVSAPSPHGPRSLSSPARLCSRRCRRCGRRVFVAASRGIGGAWSGELAVACRCQDCSGSTSRTRGVTSPSGASSINTLSHKRTRGRSHISILYRWKHTQTLWRLRYISTPGSLSALILCLLRIAAVRLEQTAQFSECHQVP